MDVFKNINPDQDQGQENQKESPSKIYGLPTCDDCGESDEESEYSPSNINHPPQVRGDGAITATINNICCTIKGIVIELFPFLSSKHAFRNRLQQAHQSVLESPCTSIFYGLIALFGILPLLCFLLTIAGVFTLFIVWFICGQVVVFCFAAAAFGGFMLFIVFCCFFIAVAFGSVIHLLYGWSSLGKYLRDHQEGIISNTLNWFGKPGVWLKQQIETHHLREE